MEGGVEGDEVQLVDEVVHGMLKGAGYELFLSDLTAFCETLSAMQYIGEVQTVSTTIFVPPENTGSYKYFAGATGGTYTVQDWVEALAVLEEEDVQSITTPSTDHDVRVRVSNHITSIQSMSLWLWMMQLPEIRLPAQRRISIP
jgi:hypothetical protein